jgi:hypothetical protein
MLEGTYKGRKFVYNQFFMEIYEIVGDGHLVKKRDFHKWEQLMTWHPVYNSLASAWINKMNGFKVGREPIED